MKNVYIPIILPYGTKSIIDLSNLHYLLENLLKNFELSKIKYTFCNILIIIKEIFDNIMD